MSGAIWLAFFLPALLFFDVLVHLMLLLCALKMRSLGVDFQRPLDLVLLERVSFDLRHLVAGLFVVLLSLGSHLLTEPRSMPQDEVGGAAVFKKKQNCKRKMGPTLYMEHCESFNFRKE